MSNTPDSIPGGYPDFKQFSKIITPERLAYIKSHPDQSAFVKDLSARFAKDPVFMKHVEAMLQTQGKELESGKLITEFKSYGWEPLSAGDLPSPRHAAAAVAAAAAAMAVPVPI